MFTGLVRDIGSIEAISDAPESRRIRVAAAWPARDRELGASVSIDGICLTVIAADDRSMSFDVGFETLRCTGAGRWQLGTRVNLEPSLRVGDAMGGHFVTGHVDGQCELLSIRSHDQAVEWWLSASPELAPFIAPKGSVAVAGVSLTVNAVEPVAATRTPAADPSEQIALGARFMVGLVPHTLAHTTLADRRVGDELNLEVDLIARYVLRQTQHNATAASLSSAGSFASREGAGVDKHL